MATTTKTTTEKRVTQQEFDQALKDYTKAQTKHTSIAAEEGVATKAITDKFAPKLKAESEKAEAAFATIKTYCDQNRPKMFGRSRSRILHL